MEPTEDDAATDAVPVSPDMQALRDMGVSAAPDVDLAGISDYDGTAGYDPRPDFVREDDERIARGER